MKLKNNKVFIGIAFLIFVVFDVCFLFAFQVSYFSKADKKIKELKVRIDAYDQEAVHREKYLSQKEKLEREIFLTESRFLGKNDVAYVLSELNAMAGKFGAEIENIKLEDIEEAGNSYGIQFYNLPVNINMYMGYNNLGRFLSLLEQKDAPIIAHKITISGESPDTVVDAVLAGVAKEDI